MIYRLQIFKGHKVSKSDCEILNSFRLDIESAASAFYDLVDPTTDKVIVSLLESGKEKLLSETELAKLRNLINKRSSK